MNSLQKFEKTLRECSAFISYTPLVSEIALNTIPILDIQNKKIFVVPQDNGTDPFLCADELRTICVAESPCILIPGTQFDTYGTRHGRGGGWYDRFLSRIPVTWIRVGIVRSDAFFESAIPKQPWDEPVDWILVCDEVTSSWNAYESLYDRR